MKPIAIILSVLALLSGCSESEPQAPPPSKKPVKARTPAPVERPPAPPSKKPEKANWMLAGGRNAAGEESFLRYIKKPEGWKSVPLSEEVSISWKFAGSLPDKALLKQMDEFEDALQSMWDSGDSCLALVITTPGLREWCFYCRDYAAFMKELNRNLSGRAAFPVSIEHSHDPEWEYWHRFIDPVKKKR